MAKDDWYNIQLAPTDRTIEARNIGGEIRKVKWTGDDKTGYWADKDKVGFNPVTWKESAPEPETVPNGLLTEAA